MKRRLLSFVVILSVMLFAFLICGGVALADDGSGSGSGVDWRVIVIPILAFLWSIYYPALRKAISAIWTTKDNFWWKVRSSIITVFTSLLPCLKEVWKGYGGVIVNLIIQLVKHKLNIASMYRAAAVHPRRL